MQVGFIFRGEWRSPHVTILRCRPVVEVVIEPDNGDEMEDEEEEEEEDIVITETMEGDGKVSAGSSLPESNGHVAEDKECGK